jgi:hypothetical protein
MCCSNDVRYRMMNDGLICPMCDEEVDELCSKCRGCYDCCECDVEEE